MNSCILMAQIVQDPELRYTPDNQTPLAQMLVQFPGQRAEDPPTTLKVIGWGNFANEIKENYTVGDRVVIEGRLSMNTIDRPEGFKEKRAELVASRIHKLGADTSFEPHVATSSPSANASASASSSKTNNVVSLRPPASSGSKADVGDMESDYTYSTPEPTFESATVGTSTSTHSDSQKDLDDIPF